MPVFEQSAESEEPTASDRDVPDVASRQRQCGRCRGLFALAPDVDDAELSDWWVCPPCRVALFPSNIAVR